MVRDEIADPSYPNADFHPDEFYKARTLTEENLACHRGKGLAGFYGAELSDCDTPFSLVNATFDWIESNIKEDIDFVVWTGDSARHDGDEEIPRTTDEVIKTNRAIADRFLSTFSDKNNRLDIPIIPTFGNNDFLPHNIFYAGPNKWLRTYSDIWRRFIPEEQRHSFEFGGWFYVEVIPQRLAVFSLNTMYFFDRNAGVDGCADPSEPGYKHLEWLRVQLARMRETGMKAILIGHVPPARTQNKQNWDETCWHKYTLWLHQFRDVVTASLYGHMNIDHFLLADSHDVNNKALKAHITAARLQKSKSDHDDVSIESKTDYLQDLMEKWSNLPQSAVRPRISLSQDDQDDSEDTEEDMQSYESDTESSSTEKKKKKKKKKRSYKKVGGKYFERYQVSLVSPSLVPNYFPTLRIIEYNITGLENTPTWLDTSPTIADGEYSSRGESQDEATRLELKRDTILDTVVNKRNGKDGKRGKKDKKGKKHKKGRKGKGPSKPKHPDLNIPDGPPNDSATGPAYFPQTLSLTSYTQYFANLTYLNNDVHGSEVETTKWRQGKQHGKAPKHDKPRPRGFEYEVEYNTLNDTIYKLPDLTVKSLFKLAYRIGKFYSAKKKTTVSIWDDNDSGDEDDGEVEDEEEYADFDLEDDLFGDDDVDEEESLDLYDQVTENVVEDEVDAEGKGGEKHKKKNKSKRSKEWLHFLSRAFVSAVPMEELEDMH